MIGDDVGRVRMHRLDSPYSSIGDLWVPSSTAGIMPTGDGYVWVADDYGWLVCYDLDGDFVSAMRNPISGTAPAGGRAYGWDPAGGRFLCVDCAASHGASGASRLKVRAFRPSPGATYLTKALPLTPARYGVVSQVRAHLCGDGGTPIASRLVEAAVNLDLDLPVSHALTDGDGDVTLDVQPIVTSGTEAVDLEVVE
jgi:hypothetical protein